jgi:hypothetical protein
MRDEPFWVLMRRFEYATAPRDRGQFLFPSWMLPYRTRFGKAASNWQVWALCPLASNFCPRNVQLIPARSARTQRTGLTLVAQLRWVAMPFRRVACENVADAGECKNLERRMRVLKVWIDGFAVMTVATSALAGNRYVEVWNPPEAHGSGNARPTVSTRTTHHRRRVKLQFNNNLPTLHDAVIAPSSKTLAANAQRRTKPSFDAIPRQITPEGNVLRVSGAHAGVEVDH